MDEAEMFKLTLNYLLMEENELSDMWSEYNNGIAMAVLKIQPKDEVGYKLAVLQAKVEHQDLLSKIYKKQNLIESLKCTLSHQDFMVAEYEKFEKENDELIELLNKIFGDV